MSKLSSLAILLMLLLFTAGCALFNSESEEQRNLSGVLTTTFHEIDSSGNYVSTIDSISISQPTTATINQTLEMDVTRMDSALYRLENAAALPDVFVFLFGVNPENGRVIEHLKVLSSSSDSSRTIHPENDKLPDDVKLHAFFIEGVGKTPDGPVNIIVEPDGRPEESIELEVDPNHHTLPHALHIEEGILGALPPAWYTQTRFEQDSGVPFVEPYLLFASRLRLDNEYFWTVSVGRQIER